MPGAVLDRVTPSCTSLHRHSERSEGLDGFGVQIIEFAVRFIMLLRGVHLRQPLLELLRVLTAPLPFIHTQAMAKTALAESETFPLSNKLNVKRKTTTLPLVQTLGLNGQPRLRRVTTFTPRAKQTGDDVSATLRRTDTSLRVVLSERGLSSL